MNDQKHKWALVTGASSGIGEVFAEKLAYRGSDLVLVARSEQKLQQLAEKFQSFGRTVKVVAADLSTQEGVAKVEQTIREIGPLDLLVNNAGVGSKGTFHEQMIEQEDQQVRLNIQALMHLTHAALPGMIANHSGAIINVASVGAFTPTAFMATYTATKAFVLSFTEALSEELVGTGVKLQVLCPGFTRTSFQDRAEVKTGHVPAIAWMTAEQVVDASLSSLARNELICVPGLLNKISTGLLALTPRSAIRKLSAQIGRQF